MRILLSVLILPAILLQACAPTAELQKARRVTEERTSYYSPLTGDHYRLPPREEPSEPAPMAMLRDTAISASPLHDDFPIVYVPPGRRMPAAPKRTQEKNKLVTSYSPLSGETVWVSGR